MAIVKKRCFSAREVRPLPSSRFSAIDDEALRSWFLRKPGSCTVLHAFKGKGRSVFRQSEIRSFGALRTEIRTDRISARRRISAVARLNAVSFYKAAQCIELPGHLKSQLLRASSSIVLNLAEGYGKFTTPDQRRFYQIGFGSSRECQAIFHLADDDSSEAAKLLDHIAASLFKLLRKAA